MTSILTATQSLCEALEVDFRLHTTKMHRRAVERNNQDSEYHDRKLQEIAAGDYDFGYKFVIESGRKYHKVVMEAHDNRSVHCFVDKETGNVFKPASWKAPAKGVRYNLLYPASREECYRLADWAGGYLYLR
jgi:hypothetical protein